MKNNFVSVRTLRLLLQSVRFGPEAHHDSFVTLNRLHFLPSVIYEQSYSNTSYSHSNSLSTAALLVFWLSLSFPFLSSPADLPGSDMFGKSDTGRCLFTLKMHRSVGQRSQWASFKPWPANQSEMSDSVRDKFLHTWWFTLRTVIP